MSSQREEIPSLNYNIRFLIGSFFGNLTADQWLLLVTGSPDQTTKALLLDLMVNIIQKLSTALLTYIRSTDVEVTKQLVKSILCNGVIDGIKDALDVTDQGQSPSAEALRDMISEEVVVGVHCSMSDPPMEHVPDPNRLDKMLTLVSNIIEAIKRKMCTPHTSGQRTKGQDLKSDEPTTSGQLRQSPDTAETPERYWYDPPSPQYEGRGRPGGLKVSAGPIVPSFAVEEAVPSPAPADPSQEEKRENAVLMVVEKLVSLIYSRCKVRHYITDPASVTERLMKRTWAAVEGVDFDPSPETVADLEEAIFKGLVEKWGCAEMALVNMKARSPALERFVVDAVKARLTAPPKKRNCIRQFFSSVGRATADFCKRSEAADEDMQSTCERV